jgi:riboflavin kinase/FMN adenylyltransferase
MALNKIVRNAVIAIGNFDGVHKGHQSIFKLGKKIANRNKQKFGVVTFAPLPYEFFQKNKKIIRITLDNLKVDLIKKNNVDFVFVCKFNKKFSMISAENFITEIVIKKLNPTHIIVGKNFRFGNKRKGNIALLRKFGKIHNFKVSDLRLAKENKTKISSTRIRLAIEKGNMDLAGRLLGRNWSIREKVIPGRKVGRQLGFRTANIIIKNNIAPKTGVYAVKAKIKDKIYDGVANFGLAPTFSRNKLVLEINLFKKIPSFYGQFAEISFVKRLRNEKSFKNKILLIRQIKKDITTAKEILKK